MTPMPRRTINDVLADAQARLRRVTPEQAAVRVREGWTLEWRVDPASGAQEPALAGKQDRLILFGNEGFSSSLAALRLQEAAPLAGRPSARDRTARGARRERRAPTRARTR